MTTVAKLEEKQLKVIDDIAARLIKLDEEIAKIDALKEAHGDHFSFRKWFEEKKAVHEIRRILKDAGKYQKYDEKEIEKIEKFFKDTF